MAADEEGEQNWEKCSQFLNWLSLNMKPNANASKNTMRKNQSNFGMFEMESQKLLDFVLRLSIRASSKELDKIHMLVLFIP